MSNQVVSYKQNVYSNHSLKLPMAHLKVEKSFTCGYYEHIVENVNVFTTLGMIGLRILICLFDAKHINK